jgi:hypothetical protein
MAEVPLAAREAQLLALLGALPVDAALAELEAACTSEERERLPAQTHGWLLRSVQLGLWSGIR